MMNDLKKERKKKAVVIFARDLKWGISKVL